MCIIAVCKSRALTELEFSHCYQNNPDGAGFAWYSGRRPRRQVAVSKGYMTPEVAWKFYTEHVSETRPHVAHFRIATAGGVSARNTHPFELGVPAGAQRLKYETDVGVLFHNGMIIAGGSQLAVDYYMRSGDKTPWPDVNDSAVAAYYAGFNPAVLTIFAGSRWALMRLSGITILGTGWVEERGVVFSNMGYRPMIENTLGPYGYGPKWRGHFRDRDDDGGMNW